MRKSAVHSTPRLALLSTTFGSLLACTPSPGPSGTSFATLTTFDETGDGDGDTGDGDGDTSDGDGDGDPGDGDPGDGDPGDGDPGDGDGDGDGDACGNGVVDPGEDCDVGSETMFCDGDCSYAMCGDGYHNLQSEQCDDGNEANDDGCVGACQINVCGDGITWLGMEACDDGNMIDTDACKNDCSDAVCGDGVIQDELEQCEDLNLVDDDACTNACQNAACGDGILWPGMEICDDGNFDDDDMCPGSCAPAFCGDGYTLADLEECDDGNEVDDDGCTNDCIALCGGTLLNPGNGILGCWYTAPNLNMSCNQVCQSHGGFDSQATQHAGNAAGMLFWPNKFTAATGRRSSAPRPTTTPTGGPTTRSRTRTGYSGPATSTVRA
jgi:cysteine-rich repeat protein